MVSFMNNVAYIPEAFSKSRTAERSYCLREAICEFPIPAGACVAIHLALEAILNGGDEVMIHSSYFASYTEQIRLSLVCSWSFLRMSVPRKGRTRTDRRNGFS